MAKQRLNANKGSNGARAEKIFKNHQYELEKYYDQTLKHSSYIFSIGVFCIVLGFLLIGITFSLIYSTDGVSEKIITGVIGSIGSLATNFIGAIYLKMYSETMKSLTEFHNRLVLTHHLHFANFLNAKIDNNELREKTLAELAQKIVQA